MTAQPPSKPRSGDKIPKGFADMGSEADPGWFIKVQDCTAMNTATPIGYGKRVIRWDEATLNETLVMLRRERERNVEAGAALLAEAENIKDNANHILEVDAMQ